jgi:hypothetical protein
MFRIAQIMSLAKASLAKKLQDCYLAMRSAMKIFLYHPDSTYALFADHFRPSPANLLRSFFMNSFGYSIQKELKRFAGLGLK